MPAATTIPPKTRRGIVQRYTRRKDPQSIRAIAADVNLTYWQVRATLLAEGVELRNRAGARQKTDTAAQ